MTVICCEELTKEPYRNFRIMMIRDLIDDCHLL